jgi:hypothetical protein
MKSIRPELQPEGRTRQKEKSFAGETVAKPESLRREPA